MKKYIFYVFYVLTFAWVVVLFIEVRSQSVKIKQLEHELKNVSIQIEQSTDKCQRMTDTCIDIIANRRWENGE